MHMGRFSIRLSSLADSWCATLRNTRYEPLLGGRGGKGLVVRVVVVMYIKASTIPWSV